MTVFVAVWLLDAAADPLELALLEQPARAPTLIAAAQITARAVAANRVDFFIAFLSLSWRALPLLDHRNTLVEIVAHNRYYGVTNF